MNAELQQLKDIHLPHDINMWWPIAPGWIGLLIVLLVFVFCVFYFWHQRKRKKYPIQYALAKLENLQQTMLEDPNNMNAALEVSTLLRRTALYYFPRENIAGLSGKDWLKFLNDSGGTNDFTDEIGLLLTDAPYRNEIVTDVMPLFDLAREWLNRLSKKNLISGGS